MLAPIIIFAFNRLSALKNTISSLLKNTESIESDLFVFVDGARDYKDSEKKQVHDVQEYVKTITGFKSLTYIFSNNNKGLGPSIIEGVTDVINRYGRCIVIEDDLIVSENMLAYVNQGLDMYENNREVFSISAYSNKVNPPKDYSYDVYFAPRSTSWGWATWKDRWMSCDWKLEDWVSVEKNAKSFNRWGGSDCFSMLRNWKEGRNQSWAIRFCYNQFLQDAVSLFPIVSKIDNDGFDGSGTNCKQWSRFKQDFDKTENKCFNMPKAIIKNKKLYKEALKYYSILIRIYSRFMYMWYDIIKH